MTLPSSLGVLLPALPLVVGAAWAMLSVVAEMVASGPREGVPSRAVGWWSVAGLLAMALLAMQPVAPAVLADALAGDAYSRTFVAMAGVLGAASLALTIAGLRPSGIRSGEVFPLAMFAVVGVGIMASATDLVVMFLGLETMSMAVYVLAGLLRADLRSNEAALKYFLLGALASALLLYGVALLYAVGGSTTLAGVHDALLRPDQAPGDRLAMVLGAALVLVGLGFKIAAVPFHLWAPDVYEGAPTPVTSFMATVVKVGGFGALLRTAMVAFAPLHDDLQWGLWAAAALTMTLGNLVALRQASLKRMLAYSSIAHTGYLLVGVAAGTTAAGAAVVFHLAAYAVATLAGFAVVIALASGPRRGEALSDYAGLGRRHPLLAATMSLAMLSLMGLPPLAGFVGKVQLLQAALAAGLPGLVVLACFNSALSAAYYLRILRVMYFEDGSAPEASGPKPASLAVAIAVAAGAVVVLLGFVPAGLVAAAAQAFSRVLLG